MKLARNLCVKYSVFIFLALLTSGAMMLHGTAFAQDETFQNVFQLAVPGGLASFDIGFVDAKIGRYFLADRTNATVDDVKTSNNTIHQLAQGAFAGVQTSATSGPNGVITANDHTEVWAADGICDPTNLPAGQVCPPESEGTSRVRVIDLKTGEVTHNIDTGGQRRADELCEDPQHHEVLVANDEDVDLFLTFISTNTYKVLGKLSLKGDDPNAGNIKAENGIEQCQWNPRTGKFYLAVPQVPRGSETIAGSNNTPGAVLVINPISRKVEDVFPIDFGFVSQHGTPGTAGFSPAEAFCLGPQGLAIGPQGEILLGCSNGGTTKVGTPPVTVTVAFGEGSVIIDDRTGDLIRRLDGLNGNDEVWYNPGDNMYFLAGSNHKDTATSSATPHLGVVDQRPDTIAEDLDPPTVGGSHSVAADPVFNQVYVPVNSGGNALCGLNSTTGCIAIFMSANHDNGICGRKKQTAFQKEVCPNGKGKPGEN